MARLTRRNLIGAGLVAPALGQSAWAQPPLEAPAERAVTPREQLLFDFGWSFAHGHGTDPSKDFDFGAGQGDFAKTGDFRLAKLGFDVSAWRTLDLPHDWAVELPFVRDDDAHADSHLRSHGYKPLGRAYPETSVGWYRREFDVPQNDAGRRIWIEFDGAFRDVFVFVNGCFIGRNDNGYAPFRFDISDFLAYGQKNVIAVRVDASFGDGWFYEGAGIYRHVWLTKTDPVHLGRWDSTVRTTVSGANAALTLASLVENHSDQATFAKVRWRILNQRGQTVANAETAEQSVPARSSLPFHAAAQIASAQLWSPEAPHLYTAVVTVESNRVVCDGERIPFGVRTLRFDAERGFFLNDRPVKIQGTCNHQDHAGVGAALPDALQNYRLNVLREMGCNAVRTSHNMPTPEWVEACDQLGVMMMCETRAMNSNSEGLAQLETMVKRYRNSPSIILWSIGNEEWQLQDSMADEGARIAATMVRRCHELDPTRLVTAAVNGGNEKGVSEPLDVIGFNYNLDPAHDYQGNLLDPYHRRHPERIVIGSETASSLSTRGEYATVAARNIMAHNGRADWGETAEQWWKFYGTREWLAGGFAWTGFDYRGEPTPYGWPSINSQFGICDMCGFAKDYYYYYRAWWRNEPLLHILPHWNWSGREGQMIDVWAYSNLDTVELFVNGRSVGRQDVPHLGHVAWQAPYQPGVIEARGYNKNGELVLKQRRETTGAATRLRLSVDRASIDADGEDVAAVKVESLDEHGRVVPDAKPMVNFTVSGQGRLIGVGNGDPNCLEADKAPRRSLFNGAAQVLVQSTKRAGAIRIAAAAEDARSGLAPATLLIRTSPVAPRPCVL